MASEGRARGDSLVETVQLEDGLEQPTALVTRGQDYLTKVHFIPHDTSFK